MKKYIYILFSLVIFNISYSQCSSASLVIDSTVPSGSNCIVNMTFCANSGGNTGDESFNTGAFGFIFFGDPAGENGPNANQNIVVNFTSSLTADSSGNVYNGSDYWNGPTEVATELIYGKEADGLIGFVAPFSNPIDWFLCKHNYTLCGLEGQSCHQFTVELSEMPDSISVVGIEGAFDVATDLVSALTSGDPIGCSDLTVYPQPCGVSPMSNEFNFDLKGFNSLNKNTLELTATNGVLEDNIFVEYSFDGVNFYEIGKMQRNSNNNYQFNFEHYYEKTKDYYYRIYFSSPDFGNKLYSKTIFLDSDNDINIYPNPATTKITIQGENIKNYEIKLHSVIGKKVSAYSQLSNDQITINAQNLDRGVYFVTIKLDDQVINKKIILE